MPTIHGRNGQHAQDLIKRGIISNSPTNEHLLLVPIYNTAFIANQLLDKEEISPGKLLNFSGVMSTSPSGITNVHFLFGPGTQKNLKVAYAGPETPLLRKILTKAEEQGIERIQTTVLEHDNKMGVIQGASHLALGLAGLTGDEDAIESLINPWKTSTKTIVDMIFINRFSEDYISQYFSLLKGNNNDPINTFKQLIKTSLTREDISRFGTPNLARILEFEGSLHLSDQVIKKVHSSLNKRGKPYLTEVVRNIRGYD